MRSISAGPSRKLARKDFRARVLRKELEAGCKLQETEVDQIEHCRSASFHLLAVRCHPASSGLCTVCIAFHARNNRQGRLEAAIGATGRQVRHEVWIFSRLRRCAQAYIPNSSLAPL